MAIIDLKKALEKDLVSFGQVLINTPPQVRQGKKNPFMSGEFICPTGKAEFKIWEERIYAPVLNHGPGIYDAEVVGSEFNEQCYLTVRRIQETEDKSIQRSDFLPRVPDEKVHSSWNDAFQKLAKLGVSANCFKLLETILKAPELGNRFFLEGAAVYHHDNKIGGLVHHTSKMLRILAAVLENNPELQASSDLLCMGIALHDVGKVFEYQDLAPSTYWYANHRVRGIEYLSQFRDEIINAYDESFYRQLQAIISGHHGDYGDRPTTVATAIVHYIDTLESQVTGLIEAEKDSPGQRLRFQEWGWLQPIELFEDD